MNNQLAKKITSYFKSKPEVIAVYIFGSYAQGMQHRLSDVDIGILLERRALKDAGKIINKCMTELPRILIKDVHPVILNTASEELLKQIFDSLLKFETLSLGFVIFFGVFEQV